MTLRLVDDIQEAAFRPSRWGHVLAELATLARGAGALLRCEHAGALRWVNTPAIEGLVEAYASRGWDAQNVRIARMSRLNRASFVTDHDLFTDVELKTERLYRDLLHPFGLGWAMATHLALPGGTTVTLSVERRHEAGPASHAGLALFNRLRPHLGRSALMAANLSFEDVGGPADAFHKVDVPAALLQASGKIVTMNPALAAVMPDVARQDRDRLHLADPVADNGLAAALAALRRGSAPPQLSMPCRAGQRASHVLHLIPVRGKARDLLTGAGTAAIFVPLTQAPVTKNQFLAALMDLTPVEAHLATLLAEGTSPIGLANKAGLDQDAVRQHFDVIFAKTGTSGFVDLARLLMRLSADTTRRSRPMISG